VRRQTNSDGYLQEGEEHAPWDQSTIHAILNRLEKTSLQNQTHRLNSIAVMDKAMEETTALKQQVETLDQPRALRPA
jgi:hypothetical protein